MDSLNFRLVVDEDGWPPFGAECLPAEKVEGGFQIKAFPFFLKDIAFDDVIMVVFDEEHYVEQWHHLAKSRYSTVWLMNRQENDLGVRLRALGCNTASLEQWNLTAVSVPPTIDLSVVKAMIAEVEAGGSVSAAYPADRQEG